MIKTEYVLHIRNLKQALKNRLVLKKVHRVIKFNQNAWLKPYIGMNTKLILKKIFLSWGIMLFLEKLRKILENTGT